MVLKHNVKGRELQKSASTSPLIFTMTVTLRWWLLTLLTLLQNSCENTTECIYTSHNTISTCDAWPYYLCGVIVSFISIRQLGGKQKTKSSNYCIVVQLIITIYTTQRVGSGAVLIHKTDVCVFEAIFPSLSHNRSPFHSSSFLSECNWD